MGHPARFAQAVRLNQTHKPGRLLRTQHLQMIEYHNRLHGNTPNKAFRQR